MTTSVSVVNTTLEASSNNLTLHVKVRSSSYIQLDSVRLMNGGKQSYEESPDKPNSYLVRIKDLKPGTLYTVQMTFNNTLAGNQFNMTVQKYTCE